MLCSYNLIHLNTNDIDLWPDCGCPEGQTHLEVLSAEGQKLFPLNFVRKEVVLVLSEADTVQPLADLLHTPLENRRNWSKTWSNCSQSKTVSNWSRSKT